MKYLLLLFMMCCVSMSLSGQRHEYYMQSDMSDGKEVALDGTALKVVIEARVALTENKEGNGYSKDWWGIALGCGDGDYYYVKMQCRNTAYNDFTDSKVADIAVFRHKDGNDELLSDVVTIDNGLAFYRGYNTIAVEWVSEEKFEIYAGDKYPRHIMTFNIDEMISGSCAIVGDGAMSIMSLVVDTYENPALPLITKFTDVDLNTRFVESKNPVEGYWVYLDRSTDDDKARLGGRYRLAIVQDGEEYLILYCDGAQVNNFSWRPFMIKGRLKPTVFTDHYDLEWYDAMMMPIKTDIHASIIKGSILSLEFPLYGTQLRFSKAVK